jgi:hypothetical protein
MIPFQFLLYYSNNERKTDILKSSFLKIKGQIELDEKQYSITLNSYLKLRDE